MVCRMNRGWPCWGALGAAGLGGALAFYCPMVNALHAPAIDVFLRIWVECSATVYNAELLPLLNRMSCHISAKNLMTNCSPISALS